MNKKNKAEKMTFLLLLMIGLVLIPQMLIGIYYLKSYSDSELNHSIEKGIKYIEESLSKDYSTMNLFETAHALRALNLLKSTYNINFTLLLLVKSWIESLRCPNYLWNFTKKLPPDLDVTIAAISALYGLSSEDFTYETLDQVSNLQLPNGAFYTWIIPENESYTEEDLHSKNDSIDLEVNGVIAFYLYKINRQRYSFIFPELAEYLSSRQNEDGTWNDTWYFGNYYGIYRTSSFLLLYDPVNYNPPVTKSLNKILSSANSDYGWGRNNISNSLDTAFCLFYLIFYYFYSHQFNRNIENAYRYLINHQNLSGSWESVPFFGVYPKNSSDPGQIIIESQLFTTSIVLETLYNIKLYRENILGSLVVGEPFILLNLMILVLSYHLFWLKKESQVQL